MVGSLSGPGTNRLVDRRAIRVTTSGLGPAGLRVRSAMGRGTAAFKGARGAIAFLLAALPLVGLLPTQAAAVGTITEFPLPQPNRNPDFVATGPDGNLW